MVTAAEASLPVEHHAPFGVDTDFGRQSETLVRDRLDRLHVAGEKLPPTRVSVEAIGVAAEDFRGVVFGIAREADNEEIGGVDLPEHVGQRLVLAEAGAWAVREEHASHPHLPG